MHSLEPRGLYTDRRSFKQNGLISTSSSLSHSKSTGRHCRFLWQLLVREEKEKWERGGGFWGGGGGGGGKGGETNVDVYIWMSGGKWENNTLAFIKEFPFPD